MAVGVRVEGLRETVAKLEKLGAESGDLKDAFNKAGQIVVNKAKPLTNPKSGRLAGSIRASRTKNKSIIRAGGARIPYAGVIHFGWPGHNIEPKNYLYGAAASSQDEVVNVIDRELNELIRRLGL